jgi:serine/threonine protein kinase
MSQCYTPIHEGQHVDLMSDDVLPFRIIGHLGMGGSATVYEVEDKANGRRFAHKGFPHRSGLALKKLKQAIKAEIDIIKRLQSHPHIVDFYWSYTRANARGILLTPVASDNDLFTYLDTIRAKQGPITLQQFSILSGSFGCLASGLAFIHSRTIRHKDVKPKNILVHNGKMIYTDFGISLDVSGQDTTTTGQTFDLTKHYCAPEVANSESRNRKADVFSLGCVFLEVIAVLEPGYDVGAFNEKIAYWKRVSEIQENLSRLGGSGSSSGEVPLICRDMMEYRSADRIEADAVLSRVQSLWRCDSKPTYELFCEDCEGSFSATAQTATNTSVEAISDMSPTESDIEEIAQSEEEDEKSQAELSISLSRVAIDLQARTSQDSNRHNLC